MAGRGTPAWAYGTSGDVRDESQGEEEMEFAPLPVYIPTHAYIPRPPFDFSNCAIKASVALVMGGAMGMVFGPLFSGHSTAAVADPTAPKVPWRTAFKEGAKEMGKASVRMGKTFGVVGLVFASSECVIEKVRGRHDLYNSVGAGCVSGALLGAQAGPQAALFGCAGFAVFSLGFDWLLGGEDPRKKMEVDDDMDQLPLKVLRHELGEDFDLKDLTDEELENLVGLKLEDLDVDELDDLSLDDDEELQRFASKVSK